MTNHLYFHPAGLTQYLRYMEVATANEPDLNMVIKGTLALMVECSYRDYDVGVFIRQILALFEKETNTLKRVYFLPLMQFARIS